MTFLFGRNLASESGPEKVLIFRGLSRDLVLVTVCARGFALLDLAVLAFDIAAQFHGEVPCHCTVLLSGQA